MRSCHPSGAIRRTWIARCALSLMACASLHAPGPIELTTEGSSVEIVIDPPSVDSHTMVGVVRAEAVGADVDVATGFAKNDMRNKGAARGATQVTVDDTIAEPIELQSLVKVTLVGRAYKPVD